METNIVRQTGLKKFARNLPEIVTNLKQLEIVEMLRMIFYIF